MELADVIMLTHILLYCFLYGCGDKEVLLLQTELLTCIMIVVGIKNLNNIFCKVCLLNRLLIITLIKGIQLEALNRLCVPDTKSIYNTVAITHNWQVKGNGTNGLITLLGKYISSVLIHMYRYISAKLNNLCILRSAKLKRVTVYQPVVRYLYLITVSDFLLEHTVTITNTATVCRIAKRSKGIQEAGSQTSQTTVTKRCIGFLILDYIDIKSQLA